MSMNDTPSGERIHIGFFGRRNAGKSSLVNAVTGQALSVVSPTKGTTTDPVRKAMEILPLGPVLIIDTPGFDDSGELGELRVEQTRKILARADLAVLVCEAGKDLGATEKQLLELFHARKIPYVIARNKADLHPEAVLQSKNEILVSSLTGAGINELKERMGHMTKDSSRRFIVRDLIRPNDQVVLVIPVDSAAPKGRIILPQQQTLRDLLDAGAIGVVTRERELDQRLASLKANPAMVITDSQVFAQVAAVTPPDVPLTSFSILMARYKGWLEHAVRGIRAVETLKDGDVILMAEGCTHHRQCDDIGTVKIPRWLSKYTCRDVYIKTVSGWDFPADVSPYAMVVCCGGCMLTPREIHSRMEIADAQGVPVTNYGVLIAYMRGVLARSLSVFPDMKDDVRWLEGTGS